MSAARTSTYEKPQDKSGGLVSRIRARLAERMPWFDRIGCILGLLMAAVGFYPWGNTAKQDLVAIEGNVRFVGWNRFGRSRTSSFYVIIQSRGQERRFVSPSPWAQGKLDTLLVGEHIDAFVDGTDVVEVKRATGVLYDYEQYLAARHREFIWCGYVGLGIIGISLFGILRELQRKRRQYSQNILTL